MKRKKRQKRAQNYVLPCLDLLRERPFDFYWGPGRFSEKKFQDPIFQKKDIQDRVNSIIRFVLDAMKKDRIVSRMKNISRCLNHLPPPPPIKIKVFQLLTRCHYVTLCIYRDT